MNVGNGIYGILNGDATLLALLANSTSIFPDVATEGALNPCIVYSEFTGEFSDTHDGVSHLDTTTVQIDIYTNTIAQRQSISSRVRTLLDRYSGTSNSVVIQSIQLVFSLATVEPIIDKQTTKIFRQTMDFKVRQIN